MFEKFKDTLAEIGALGLGCFGTAILIILFVALCIGLAVGVTFFWGWIAMLLWNFLAPLVGIEFVFTIWHGVVLRIGYVILRKIFGRKTIITKSDN